MQTPPILSLIHISEPTRRTPISSSSPASDVYKRHSTHYPSGKPGRPRSTATFRSDRFHPATLRCRLLLSCLLYTSPSPRDGLLSHLRRQRQMCIRDTQHTIQAANPAAQEARQHSALTVFTRQPSDADSSYPVSYTHLRAHETDSYLIFVASVRCV